MEWKDSDNTSVFPAHLVHKGLGPETSAHLLSPSSCKRPVTFLRLFGIQDQAVSSLTAWWILPWNMISLEEIHLLVWMWGRGRNEDVASEVCVLWRAERHLLHVGSLAATPVNCAEVFSLSLALLPTYTQRSNSCMDFCAWQYFSLVPQSEHFSCRTSHSSASCVLPVTQPIW